MIFTLLCSFLGVIAGNCPSGSNQSLTDKTSCYFFVTQKTTFMAADEYCVGLGGNLASVHNMFENVFLGGEAHTVFNDSTDNSFWIGANNLLIPGIWGWMDGTPFDFTDWDKGQPQNISDTSCGALITQTQTWISDDCIKDKPFVCLVKIAAPTVNLPPTTTTTRATTKTTTIAITTTTTTKSNLCPDSWSYFNVTNKCYKVFIQAVNWQNAETNCINVGSHLVSIHSWEENMFVAELASLYSPNRCDWASQTLIGLSTADNNQHWSWSDGTTFDYAKWQAGEPNNPGTENCCALWTGLPCEGLSPAEFNNVPCSTKLPNFVCKKTL